MSQRSLDSRVTILEEKVTSLEGLPERMERVELQIVQLREEMRSEFSAVRAETNGLGETLRGEIRDLGKTLRGEMHDLGETLRGEIRAGDEDTRRFMGVLHEDLVARIAAIGEGPRRGRKRR